MFETLKNNLLKIFGISASDVSETRGRRSASGAAAAKACKAGMGCKGRRSASGAAAAKACRAGMGTLAARPHLPVHGSFGPGRAVYLRTPGAAILTAIALTASTLGAQLSAPVVQTPASEAVSGAAVSVSGSALTTNSALSTEAQFVGTEAVLTEEETANLQAAAAAGVYSMSGAVDGYRKFENYTMGFGIEIPAYMKAANMDHSDLVSVFKDSHRQLKIFKNEVSSVASYLNYNYTFLSNTTDYTYEYHEEMTLNGRKAYLKQWSRDRLSKVKDDKNYYASIDIVDGNTVWNFFFKGDLPFYICGGYMDIVNSFYTFEPTADAYDLTGSQTEKECWNSETKELYQDYFLGDEDLAWGIYEPSAPLYNVYLYEKEKLLNYKFKFLLHYTNVEERFDNRIVGQALDNAWTEKRVVELTLQTPNVTSDSNMIYDILDGDYDTFFHEYARSIGKFGHPVLFRPFNEMNGDWCNYSAYATGLDTDIYCSLCKYIYGVFQEEGADKNTIWVWNPNGKSYPNYKWNDMRCYYPGDIYCDLMGITGYNTGTYYEGEKWQTFDEIYTPIYNTTMKYYTQPMIITEFACSSCGGDKPAWIEDMFAKIRNYENIKVAIWWDGCDWDAEGNEARPYYISQPDSVAQTFRAHLYKFRQFK